MPLSTVVDLSHHNGNIDLLRARDAGLLGVIHKATQSTRFVDPKYEANRRAARDAGLLWGAYHFGAGGRGADQARHFLNVVQPGPDDLLVLDYERNPRGETMGLVAAREFVTCVAESTGRYPGVYGGGWIKSVLGNRRDATLGRCWCWIAQYATRPRLQATWTNWTLWQYTDGRFGPEPHSVPGIGPCDRDQFQGDEVALRAFWSRA